ncbi:ABC transporter ATP-binding protein [Pseudomonas mangiferae]|uniref:Spermidine/putrescine import ATP-binding protein PotA n=1 Tax=Pseudomonas mangiferae TaxID=2593654 RepID=A0A553H3G4_9PSED|nr:ABC transporter ATP-binding protein [Pseudomonas mangiferae]TRX76303.1 ABC transporter ATP-binding protein [Pseudomonas mangiferae]
MPALLNIEAVSKRFGAFTALRDIHLHIGQREFVALLGPSGCGKTTLLRTIAGFSHPDSGRLLMDGQDIGPLPPYRRPLNTVFQNYALFPHMTVQENVAYGPRRQGASRREAGERAREALTLVGLEDLGERYPREMSGGQQQRVALARAIVNRPKLLLLDEPLSALDLKLRKRMQLELKHLQEKLGIAFVFVTHDQEEAMTMADRIVVMNAGRIEQVGSATEIYSTPASRFVAEFIGDANLVDYRVDAQGRARLALPVADLTLPAPDASDGVAVLRPEHLRLVDAGEPGQLRAQVRDIVTVGSHTLLHVETDDGMRLVARTPGLPEAHLGVGSRVALGFDPARLHLIGTPR